MPDPSLRQRIEAGELAAFLDPALSLDLLADPGGAWWWLGCDRVLAELLEMHGLTLPQPVLAEALFAWAKDRIRPTDGEKLAAAVEQVRLSASPRSPWRECMALVRRGIERDEGISHGARYPARQLVRERLVLLRRLRELGLMVPPVEAAALTVMARYGAE